MKISENTDNRVRKSAVCIMAAVLMMCGTLASCGNTHTKTTDSSAETSAPSADESTQETSAQDDSGSQNAANTEFVADLLPTSDEDIGENSFIITLREDKAPITCENFEKLVSEGFYDGTTFHRVVNDFMAQGGDPEGTGMGGSGTNIKGEFSANGVKNDLKHMKGIVSMARAQDNDSASSQFFICYDEVSFLDGQYAAFGQVTQGMEVVDRFLNVDRKLNSSYELAEPIQPITIIKAEMIDPDANGHKRAKFTMDFTEREFKEGKFIITLNAEKAPISCENFEKLVNDGFYNGSNFHRVIDGFMAQGGAPASAEEMTDTIKGEFTENGVDNDLKHVKGTVSMARAEDPDSASSQFFICFDTCENLDGKYAAFGKVTEGMDVVDGFTSVTRGVSQTGEVSVPGSPITIVKAEMIDPDENGNHRVEFTVNY